MRKFFKIIGLIVVVLITAGVVVLIADTFKPSPEVLAEQAQKQAEYDLNVRYIEYHMGYFDSEESKKTGPDPIYQGLNHLNEAIRYCNRAKEFKHPGAICDRAVEMKKEYRIKKDVYEKFEKKVGDMQKFMDKATNTLRKL
jgi:hypothetical protein